MPDNNLIVPDRKRISRRSALKLAGAGAAVSMMGPGFVRYAQAQSSEPIRIGFQVHRTGIGAAYGRWYERATTAAVKLINEQGGVTRLGLGVPEAFLMAVLIGIAVSVLIGLIALRASGVAFMIVTLMFSQAAFLTVLYFGEYTRGDEGIVIPDTQRVFSVMGADVNLADPLLRHNLALAFLALAIVVCLAVVRSKIGHVLVAIRENENRTAMLGYDVWRYKLIAFVLSGSFAAFAGAAYAQMFAYAGSTLASIQYSIHPLLWTLLGGAATVLGPVIGTGLMFLLVDFASGFTSASLLVVGVVLIILVLFFPKGILGTLRQRIMPWLP